MKKLKVGVSACLIGLKYRYDGSSKFAKELVEALDGRVDFIPVCPEVECGMATPRPPMRLEVSSKGERLKVIGTGEDKTAEMESWAEGKLEQLERRDVAAFILKSKSPSCALCSAQVFRPDGKVIKEGAKGLFTRLLARRFPGTSIIEDSEPLPDILKKLNLD